MHAAILILCTLVAAIPPLSPDEQSRLAMATDGVQTRGDAFEALLANAGRWTPGLDDTPIRLVPDLDAMVARPDEYRGALCRLSGRLEQQSWLTPPDEQVAEWFMRDADGTPMLVYVAGLDRKASFRDGGRVTMPARFYKRVYMEARDGRTHRYPAFVGAMPEQAPADPAWAQAWAVTIPVIIMLVVFLALLVYARRGGRVPPVRGAAAHWPDDGTLPADPSAALAEMRRRAEAAE